jgi:hypothetical protein
MKNDDKEEWIDILTEAAVALVASAAVFILLCLIIWISL